MAAISATRSSLREAMTIQVPAIALMQSVDSVERATSETLTGCFSDSWFISSTQEHP